MLRATRIPAIALATALLVGVPAAQADTPSSGFVVVANPALQGQLEGVTAVSADDAWAVGSTTSPTFVPLIEHWDGASWTRVTAPDPGDGDSQLLAVSAGGGAVWAVGWTEPTTSLVGICDHLVGSTWESVALPAKVVELIAVHAFSDTNVWVGGLGLHNKRLLMHWNGTTWRTLKDAGETGAFGAQINGLAGVGKSKLFAAGSWSSSGAAGGWFERNVPGGWQRLATSPGGSSGLSAVSATSPKNAWTVGFQNGATATQPVAIHWNGTTATEVDPPQPAGSPFANLTTDAAVSSKTVWATGTEETSSSQFTILIERYTGAWKQLAPPTITGANPRLSAITGVPGSSSELWAVGSAGNSPLILHHPG